MNQITTEQAIQFLVDNGMKLSVDGGINDFCSSVISTLIGVVAGGIVTLWISLKIEKNNTYIQLQVEENNKIKRFLLEYSLELIELKPLIKNKEPIPKEQYNRYLKKVETLIQYCDTYYIESEAFGLLQNIMCNSNCNKQFLMDLKKEGYEQISYLFYKGTVEGIDSDIQYLKEIDKVLEDSNRILLGKTTLKNIKKRNEKKILIKEKIKDRLKKCPPIEKIYRFFKRIQNKFK